MTDKLTTAGSKLLKNLQYYNQYQPTVNIYVAVRSTGRQSDIYSEQYSVWAVAVWQHISTVCGQWRSDSTYQQCVGSGGLTAHINSVSAVAVWQHISTLDQTKQFLQPALLYRLKQQLVTGQVDTVQTVRHDLVRHFWFYQCDIRASVLLVVLRGETLRDNRSVLS